MYSRGKKQNKASCKKRLTIVFKVEDNDLLLGRGSSSANHIGNKRFRTMVTESLNDYWSTDDHPTKAAISKAVMEEFLSNGGRFLERVGPKTWAVVDDQAILIARTKQLFRDMKTRDKIKKSNAKEASISSKDSDYVVKQSTIDVQLANMEDRDCVDAKFTNHNAKPPAVAGRPDRTEKNPKVHSASNLNKKNPPIPKNITAFPSSNNLPNSQTDPVRPRIVDEYNRKKIELENEIRQLELILVALQQICRSKPHQEPPSVAFINQRDTFNHATISQPTEVVPQQQMLSAVNGSTTMSGGSSINMKSNNNQNDMALSLMLLILKLIAESSTGSTVHV